MKTQLMYLTGIVVFFFIGLLFTQPIQADLMPWYQFDQKCKFGEETTVCQKSQCQQFIDNRDYYFLEEDITTKKADNDHPLLYCKKITSMQLLQTTGNVSKVVLFDYLVNLIVLTIAYCIVKKPSLIFHVRFLFYTLIITIAGGIIDTIFVFALKYGEVKGPLYPYFTFDVTAGIIISIFTSVLLFLSTKLFTQKFYPLSQKQTIIIALFIALFTNPAIYYMVSTM